MAPFGAAHLLTGATAGLFLYAASFKALDVSPLANTLEELGLTPWSARVGARAIPVFELTCGVAIVLLQGSWVSTLALTVAAVGIGSAGVIALRRPSSIRCACFSSYSDAQLGWRQIVTALGLGIIALVNTDVGTRLAPTDALTLLIVVSLVGTAVHVASSLREILVSVDSRRMMSTVYPA